MNEKKLTDEEIVKALEHCATENTCRGCVKYNGETKIDYFKCMRDTRKNVVDLFHRLQAENERLNDMKFTQEHCDLYKENELLKSALKRELAENEALRKGRVITQTVDYCADDLAKALKTIDEQKAEIERLIREVHMRRIYAEELCDLIAEQKAEIERLTRDKNDIMQDYQDLAPQVLKQDEENERLRKRVNELEKELAAAQVYRPKGKIKHSFFDELHKMLSR